MNTFGCNKVGVYPKRPGKKAHVVRLTFCSVVSLLTQRHLTSTPVATFRYLEHTLCQVISIQFSDFNQINVSQELILAQTTLRLLLELLLTTKYLGRTF